MRDMRLCSKTHAWPNSTSLNSHSTRRGTKIFSMLLPEGSLHPFLRTSSCAQRPSGSSLDEPTGDVRVSVRAQYSCPLAVKPFDSSLLAALPRFQQCTRPGLGRPLGPRHVLNGLAQPVDELLLTEAIVGLARPRRTGSSSSDKSIVSRSRMGASRKSSSSSTAVDTTFHESP